MRVVGSNYRTQPLQVVQRALELQKEARRSASGTVPFDDAWCVIDGDYGDKVGIARNAINDRTTHLAISTPCFEYWILLHFAESAQPAVDCNEVISILRAGPIPEYNKGIFDHSRIIDRAVDAASRARKLREPRKAIDPLPEMHNPCSEIYLLIEELL